MEAQQLPQLPLRPQASLAANLPRSRKLALASSTEQSCNVAANMWVCRSWLLLPFSGYATLQKWHKHVSTITAPPHPSGRGGGADRSAAAHYRSCLLQMGCTRVEWRPRPPTWRPPSSDSEVSSFPGPPCLRSLAGTSGGRGVCRDRSIERGCRRACNGGSSVLPILPKTR